jgi:hypothetical protein
MLSLYFHTEATEGTEKNLLVIPASMLSVFFTQRPQGATGFTGGKEKVF